MKYIIQSEFSHRIFTNTVFTKAYISIYKGINFKLCDANTYSSKEEANNDLFSIVNEFKKDEYISALFHHDWHVAELTTEEYEKLCKLHNDEWKKFVRGLKEGSFAA